MKTNSGTLNRVVGGLIKQMKFKVMKERLHKLIDFLFSDVPDEKKSAKRRTPKVLWHKPLYKDNPLEEPKGQRPIPGLRVTPFWIDELEENEVFVFGSNTKGIHDRGASFTAVQYFGAIVGQPEGPQGQSYAIPTDGANLEDIKASVNNLIVYAKAHPHLTFLVTEIGCGTAGYHPMEIGPLLNDAVSVPNTYLPKMFWKYLAK